MSNAITKIAKLDNLMVDVKVSEISGKNQFLGRANLSHFNPNQSVPNGGPVTKKAVNVEALGVSYDEAYNNVLERAVQLMGL